MNDMKKYIISERPNLFEPVGIVNSNARGDAQYRTSVRGKVIVDHSNASQYMKNIGYS